VTNLRTVLRVDIVVDSPWAIGAAAATTFQQRTADGAAPPRADVLRSPDGELMVPASGLVGSLRTHLKDDVRWLGPRETDEGIAPSPLRCLSASIVAKPEVTARSTTAIDPVRRAALGGTFRTEEVAAAGAEVRWWIVFEHGADHETPVAEVDRLVDELLTWRPTIGRGRSIGRGRARVSGVWHRTVDLETADGLQFWLEGRHTDVAPAEPWTHRPSELGREEDPWLEVGFEVVDGLHLGLGEGRREANRRGDERTVLTTGREVPATSWKGILRSRVAHIVRVTAGDDAADVTVARLFGTPRGLGASEDGGHRGLLRFSDSPVRGTTMTRTHVAIDRITGGARQITRPDARQDTGALFTVEFFKPGARFDLRLYADGPISDADARLIDLAIKDLNDGIIGIAGMTTRGYGTVREIARSGRRTAVSA